LFVGYLGVIRNRGERRRLRERKMYSWPFRFAFNLVHPSSLSQDLINNSIKGLRILSKHKKTNAKLQKDAQTALSERHVAFQNLLLRNS
jgi:hypothetical protein